MISFIVTFFSRTPRFGQSNPYKRVQDSCKVIYGHLFQLPVRRYCIPTWDPRAGHTNIPFSGNLAEKYSKALLTVVPPCSLSNLSDNDGGSAEDQNAKERKKDATHSLPYFHNDITLELSLRPFRTTLRRSANQNSQCYAMLTYSSARRSTPCLNDDVDNGDELSSDPVRSSASN